MKKAEELRLEVSKLEDKIKIAVTEFTHSVGCCDIRVNVRSECQYTQVGRKIITGHNVKVDVTV